MHQVAGITPTDPVGRQRQLAADENIAAEVSQATGATADDRPVTVLRAPAFSVGALLRGVARLFQYHDLLYTLSLHRLQVRYKQSVLGPLWAVLQPLSLMLIYTVVFSRVARLPSEGLPYALFAYCALLPWTFFGTAVSTATTSLVSHTNLVTKVYFPREILPLTYVFAAFVDLLAASTVLGALMVYYQIPLTANLLWAVPVLVVLMMFTLGVALVLSAIQVRYRDIGIALPLVLQISMFATPVVYPLSVVPSQWQTLYSLNPMVGIVESFRRVVVQGAPPAFEPLGIAALCSVLLLPAAFVYFKRVEATMADLL
jgi:lipopolysaccharide transport system permease protein